MPCGDVGCRLSILQHTLHYILTVGKPASSDDLVKDDGGGEKRGSAVTTGYDETLARMIMEYISSDNVEAS